MKRLLLPIAMIASLLNLHGGEQPLEVGAPAPAVTGITDANTPLDFSALYAKGLVLVYFFPKADTPGCTAQGCSLCDAYTDLADKGVTVVGVSTDKVAAQAAFRAKYHFPFTLIADEKQEVARAFGVPVTLGFAARQAFLIENGKIVWRDLKARTKEQAADVLAVLAGLHKPAS